MFEKKGEENRNRHTINSFIKTFNEITKNLILYKDVIFSVFTSHVIKTKSRNHSMKKSKNLGYDRWLQYKQPRQESGLCRFSFGRYSRKCATQIYRALYGDAMFVPFCGAQIWRSWRNKNICRWVLLLEWNFYSGALTHWNKCFF